MTQDEVDAINEVLLMLSKTVKSTKAREGLARLNKIFIRVSSGLVTEIDWKN
jgi:hypothetical protein